jgi:tetratricopeptide (TPR) repeat protein
MNSDYEKHFMALKTKWFYGNVPQNCSDPYLYQILLNLDQRFVFDGQVDIEWLKSRSFFPIIANIYFQRYSLTTDGWNLVKACSNFRKARFPQIAIYITNQYPTIDNKIISAILTTRGAAFKDIKDLLNAEKCANDALSYNRTKYPLTLLGAIYYLYGRYAEGDEFFNEAEKLGASTDAHDREIKITVESAEVAERKIVAEHLMHKDPNRYSWAEIYLKE